jgi:uncharacterized protein YqjF (DUF2071 family)
MHEALKFIAHRPWPLPRGSWIMAQTWHDLLFAHWPIPSEVLRPLVPSQLQLDVFDYQCWVGVVPFWMSGVRARTLPGLPGLSRFPELNVRTYVSYDDKPGVYFFSLDATNAPAVWAARTFYHLPYFHADMSAGSEGEEISYTSTRREGHAEFKGRYAPCGPVRLRDRGTVEHWLTERYCLYTVHHGKVYRGDIHHAPWPLQDACAEITVNSTASSTGISLPDRQPLLHFARRLEVLIWPLRQVS